jgi:late competence protein required for DNA uptake (superfamily II DNA/RNA helicase)
MKVGIVVAIVMWLIALTIIFFMIRPAIREHMALRRRIKETQTHHPGITCLRCGAENTQLMRDLLTGQYFCKDQRTCRIFSRIREHS